MSQTTHLIFQVSDERREQGTIQSLKEGFGFMRCAERDGRMFFHFSEWLDVKRPQEVGDECEFTVAPDPNQPSRLLATRIKRLPVGKLNAVSQDLGPLPP
jgi:cold shock CspA family protein